MPEEKPDVGPTEPETNNTIPEDKPDVGPTEPEKNDTIPEEKPDVGPTQPDDKPSNPTTEEPEEEKTDEMPIQSFDKIYKWAMDPYAVKMMEYDSAYNVTNWCQPNTNICEHKTSCCAQVTVFSQNGYKDVRQRCLSTRVD